MTLSFFPTGINLVSVGAALVGFAMAGHELLKIAYFRHETDTAHGTAKWASKKRLMKDGLFAKEGMILGRVNGRLVREQTNKHLLTLAPNRAGKGVSSIIPNLLTWPGSVLVIDPKGENAIVTARARRAMGQSVYVLDPWGITGQARARFNPLLSLAPQSHDIAEDAALLADGLVIPAAKGEEEFWNNEARALISGILMHIATTELPEDRHLGKLRAMLTAGEDGFDAILDEMAENKSAHGLIARAARRMRQKTDKERSGVMSTAQAQTHFLDRPRTPSRGHWVPMFRQLVETYEGLRILQKLAEAGMKAWGCKPDTFCCTRCAFKDVTFRSHVIAALEDFAETAQEQHKIHLPKQAPMPYPEEPEETPRPEPNIAPPKPKTAPHRPLPRPRRSGPSPS